MPLAAAMSATALTAAAAVSDSGGNSGGPCDDGGCTSNSSTGGAPPLKDAVFERSTPGSAWASSQQAVAHLETRAQTMCGTGGTASSNGYHIPGAGTSAGHGHEGAPSQACLLATWLGHATRARDAAR